MGISEVTQEQWQNVMGSVPGKFTGNNLPVSDMTWNDAQVFVSKLNAMNDGYTYRLPTEAEWEYACRAGTKENFVSDLDAVAWHTGNANSMPHPVKSKKPNAFGLYDMHGNVLEVCQDGLHQSYVGAPADGREWEKGAEKAYRIIRGGSFYSDEVQTRCSRRAVMSPDKSFTDTGIRLVAVKRP